MFRKINNKKLTVIVFTVILAVSLAITAFAADQTGSRQTFNRNKPVRICLQNAQIPSQSM
jgi:hypothetical protein